MSTDAEPEPEQLVKLEKAVSSRSTCRATGEKIEKGEWRCGIEAWRAGRMSMTWQKAVPFLKNCLFETIEKGNAGTCKLTGHKFAKGETRFVCSTGDKRLFFTIPAAAKVVGPVLEAVGSEFSATDFQGLDGLKEEDRELFSREFGVSPDAAAKPAKPKAEPNAEPKAEPGADGAESQEAEHKAAARPSRKRGKAGDAPATPAKRQRRGRAKQPTPEPEESEEGSEKEGSDAAELEDSEAEAMEQEEAAEAEQPEAAAEEEEKEEPEGDESAAEDESEAGAAAEEAADPNEEGLPDFERRRRAIIARNQERIRQLGLKEAAEEVMPAPKPKPRVQSKGLTPRKKAQADAGPRRASLRQQGIAADGQMISRELRNGAVVATMQGGGSRQSGDKQQPQEPEQPQERHRKEPLPFESSSGEEGADECFLELLRRSTADEAKGGASQEGSRPLWELSLRDEDVAKVTDNGITHIQWHPSADRPVVAAADKSGNLGLWAVDHPADSPGDGVLSFKPHKTYVSGLRWAGEAGAPVKLLSCSYDGSIRLLDAAAGRFELTVSDEEAEFSAFDCSADGRTAIAGDNDGLLHLFDVREGRGSASGKPAELHTRRINTLQFSPSDEHIFLSSSADNSLAVWDTRKLSGGACKPLASATHPKTCQSAYFAPDGSGRIVSLSRDDTIRVWQYEGKASLRGLAVMRHHNNTGRWILPFRANWSPQADAIIVGNMKRSVDIYSPEGKLQGQLQSEHMTAISSRAAVHPRTPMLAAATASGRIHIYR